MLNTMICLSDIHYRYGFIDLDEYCERVSVARWLTSEFDKDDPRENIKYYEHGADDTPPMSEGDQDVQDDEEFNVNSPFMEMLVNKVWVFTKSDRDSYPSIPHGHYRSQNKTWPKLNPYTGYVYKRKHQAESKLSRQEMINMWRDEGFKSFCREMIVWYLEEFPAYEFPVARPLKLPRW
ncbi:hypothetical protein [Cobetia sp. 1CM21F]|uniref:hypothetical protein n=1 Tax=Cobetia sp. 1CM21F TaxID=2929163 RepID=UPI0020BE4283|nr:hypothetical protein [Cobetia sp. 1CM21F]MCK8067213.1 hypothetical protein [Cobetia sp. 1CM21F]